MFGIDNKINYISNYVEIRTNSIIDRKLVNIEINLLEAKKFVKENTEIQLKILIIIIGIHKMNIYR